MSTEIDYEPVVWGWIKNDDGSKTAYNQTGTDYNPNVAQNDDTSYARRAYFSFDTSTIPSVATIVSADFCFKFTLISEPVGFVGTYQLSVYYDHDRIGAAISTDDWDFDDLGGTKSFPSLPSIWTEYVASLATAAVNKAGDTDVEVRCTGAFADPPGAMLWKLAARRSGPVHHCYLTVTYTVPGGLFNRWNLRLPALPGFSNVITAVVLASGDLKVMARFYPRALEA